MATCIRTMSRAHNLFLCPRRIMIMTSNIQRRRWLLSMLIPFITVQSDNRREITIRNEASGPAFLAQDLHPPCEILRGDESHSINGTTTLRAAKLRTFFQWGRTMRAPRPPSAPSGRGKPEDDSRGGGKLSPSRRGSDVSAPASTTGNSTTSTRQWTSRSSCHSHSNRWGNHDDGPDWDW